ncbi:MAG: hypothetical protein MJE66_03365, partial [Proteobacteria bacterium]|nr:hypothetical protein [Pseudomonadota bacterium]
MFDDEGFLGLDAVLPEQFFEPARPVSAPLWVQKLMYAVLEEAVRTFQRHALDQSTQVGKEAFEEARRWLFECDDEESISPFSFLRICDVLNIHADYLRRGLSRWHELALRSPREARILPTRRAPDRPKLEARTPPRPEARKPAAAPKRLRPSRHHGSECRLPGAQVRALATLWKQKAPTSSVQSIARRLAARLAKAGIEYDLRTVKRQIAGQVETVPPEV